MAPTHRDDLVLFTLLRLYAQYLLLSLSPASRSAKDCGLGFGCPNHHCRFFLLVLDQALLGIL
jgi:hypothetical protein